jgi:hypothetical protein
LELESKETVLPLIFSLLARPGNRHLSHLNGTIDNPLQGNENELFLKRYGDVLKEWKKLKKEYE